MTHSLLRLMFTILVVLAGGFTHFAAAQDVLMRPAQTMLGLRFSPDGRLLAQVFATGELRVIDGQTQQSIFQFSPPLDLPLLDAQVDWSNDGRYLAAGVGAWVYIWNTSTWQLLQTTITGLTSGLADREAYLAPEGVVSLQWSDDDAMLLALSVSVRLTIWRFPSGEVLFNQVIVTNYI